MRHIRLGMVGGGRIARRRRAEVHVADEHIGARAQHRRIPRCDAERPRGERLRWQRAGLGQAAAAFAC